MLANPTVEFSRRERVAATTSKSERSCARSGRLQRWVRRAGPSFRVAASPRAPPRHGTTRHDGRVAEPHQHAITPARRDVRQNHAPHAITPAYRALIGTTRSTRSRRARRAIRTTGDHTTFAQRAVRTTGERTTSAPRAFSTTGGRTTPTRRASAQRKLAPRAFTNRARCHDKRCADHVPQPPNGLAFSCRERAA